MRSERSSLHRPEFGHLTGEQGMAMLVSCVS